MDSPVVSIQGKVVYTSYWKNPYDALDKVPSVSTNIYLADISDWLIVVQTLTVLTILSDALYRNLLYEKPAYIFFKLESYLAIDMIIPWFSPQMSVGN